LAVKGLAFPEWNECRRVVHDDPISRTDIDAIEFDMGMEAFGRMLDLHTTRDAQQSFAFIRH
jgi:hypothetical protein